MSVGSIGAGGLPDDQAVTMWGADVLALDLTTGQIGNYQTPDAINTSAFGYIYSYLELAVNPVNLEWQWWIDQAATIPVGSRAVALDVRLDNPAQLLFPNLGPWFTLAGTPLDGATHWTPTFHLILTNRHHFLEAQPPALFDDSPAYIIPASASVTHFPGGTYGGPVQWFFRAGTTAVTFSLQHLRADMSYREFAAFTLAANATLLTVVHQAASANRLVITNNDAVNPNTGGSWKWVPSETGG